MMKHITGILMNLKIENEPLLSITRRANTLLHSLSIE